MNGPESNIAITRDTISIDPYNARHSAVVHFLVTSNTSLPNSSTNLVTREHLVDFTLGMFVGSMRALLLNDLLIVQ